MRGSDVNVDIYYFYDSKKIQLSGSIFVANHTQHKGKFFSIASS